MTSDNNNKKQAKSMDAHQLLLLAERISEFTQLTINAVQNGAKTGTVLYPLFEIEAMADTLTTYYDRLHQSDEARLKMQIANGQIQIGGVQ